MIEALRAYLKDINKFALRVDELTNFLNTNNMHLEELIRKFESLSPLFQRTETLLGMLKEFSETFKKEIQTLRKVFFDVEDVIRKTTDNITNLVEIFKTTIEELKELEMNASEIIKKSRLLAPLALNAEIKAFHSKEEGRGLAVIAREVGRLVDFSHKSFMEFAATLDRVKKISQSATVEFARALELSSYSSRLYLKAQESLKTIDELIKSLEKMPGRVEDGIKIFSTLQATISMKLKLINEQLIDSLNTVDEISRRGTEISALAGNLGDLYRVLGIQRSLPNPYIYNQFIHLIDENIRVLSKIGGGHLPVIFSEEIYKETDKIYQQIPSMKGIIDYTNEIAAELIKEIDNLIDLQKQIEKYFLDVEGLFNGLKDIGLDLTNELERLEINSLEAAGVFSRLKILSIFARLEESRGKRYQSNISPVVEEFSQLSVESEGLCKEIENRLGELKKSVSSLTMTKVDGRKFVSLKKPDFTKIKIFLDDINRVFDEKIVCIQECKGMADELHRNNLYLRNLWDLYEDSMKKILSYREKLKSLSEKIPRPAPVVKKKSVLTTHLSSDPLTLKGDLKTDANSHQVIINSSLGLFQFGKGADVISGLCDNYEVSKSGTEYTFHIREDLKYADGTRLRVEDLKEGIIRALKGPNFNFFEMIAGAQDYLQTGDVKILGVEILDERTIKIITQYPFLPILANLATNVADPYIDAEYPIGAGPFRIVLWERSKRLLLVANDFYFGGRPAVDELQFLIINDDEYCYELFKKGILSIYRPGEKTLRSIKSETPELLYSIPELSVQFIAIHCQKFPFSNRLVRQALNYAIDRDSFVMEFLKESAVPARGIFPPSMKVYNNRIRGFNYDPAKGRVLLAEAGFPGGLPDTYPFDVSDSPAVIKRAEFISSALREIGVKTEVNPLPWHILLDKSYNGNSLLSLQGWISDNGDPDNFLYPLFHSSSIGYPGNTFFFSDPEIDQMLDLGRKIRNENQRINFYRQIEERILNEAPGVFLYHSLENIAVQKDIMGIKPHPLSLIRAKHISKIEEDFCMETIAKSEIEEELCYERHHLAHKKF
ncbi:MAG: ABC transporter substrate-binding protein [candidate division WOR-3 bacterium]